MSYRAELVGLLGQPVDENPTGAMQEAAFEEAHLDWRYVTMEVAPAKLGAAMKGVKALGFRGLNLTIPHKVAVLKHLDELTPAAKLIGAVNTVAIRDGHTLGENTDGKGFLRGVVEDARVEPAGKRVLLLGAGGAARAIAAELALAGVSSIHVVNRDPERGETMVRDLREGTGVSASLSTWPVKVSDDIDIVVNATSIGLYPDIDRMPDIDLGDARPQALVCDAVFNPSETRLLRAARKRGMRTLDGLSMLVYQGAIGFELWTGKPAPERVMKNALRRALAA